MELFHATPCWNTESIRENGLELGRMCPADQTTNNETGDPHEHPEDPPLEEPTDAKAQWKFDEILNDAQYTVGKKNFPTHDSGIFFFPTVNQAKRSTKNTGWNSDVFVVDSEEIPDDCTCARGDFDHSEEMYAAVRAWYNDFASSHMQDEEVFEEAKDFWKDVCDPQDSDCDVTRDDEVWCGCDIPPKAIVRVT